MIYRYIYKTTCINKDSDLLNHYYLGKHTTKNLNDGYIGSSRILRKYNKDYPNSCKKEIIGFYDSDEELSKAEKHIILQNINDPYCINKNVSSCGGNTRKLLTEEQKISQSAKLSNNTKERWNNYSNEEKQTVCNNISKNCKGHQSLIKGKKLDDNWRHNISLSKIGKHPWNIGKKLPMIADIQQGTKYMNDGTVQVRIKPEYWGEFIDIGFKFGCIK